MLRIDSRNSSSSEYSFASLGPLGLRPRRDPLGPIENINIHSCVRVRESRAHFDYDANEYHDTNYDFPRFARSIEFVVVNSLTSTLRIRSDEEFRARKKIRIDTKSSAPPRFLVVQIFSSFGLAQRGQPFWSLSGGLFGLLRLLIVGSAANLSGPLLLFARATLSGRSRALTSSPRFARLTSLLVRRLRRLTCGLRPLLLSTS